MKYIILYRVFIRKTYKSWHKSRSLQAWALAFGIIFLHIVSLLLLLEGLTGIPGLLYVSHHRTVPLVPFAIFFGFIFYVLYMVFFSHPKKQSNLETTMIRKSINDLENVNRNTVICYLLFSVFLFITSLIIAIMKVKY